VKPLEKIGDIKIAVTDGFPFRYTLLSILPIPIPNRNHNRPDALFSFDHMVGGGGFFHGVHVASAARTRMSTSLSFGTGFAASLT
jgi:hypothetical protein